MQLIKTPETKCNADDESASETIHVDSRREQDAVDSGVFAHTHLEKGKHMRTIMDYPDVDSFMDDVDKAIRDDRQRGFGFHILHDPYSGHGFVAEYVTQFGTSFGIELTLGVTDKLFVASLSATPPFDTHKLNTLGREDQGNSRYKQLSAKLGVLFAQIHISFIRS